LDIPWSAVHPEPDEAELSMYRHAAKMAREILTEELPHGVGLTDHEFVARLELKYRRAGAEDLVVLLTNGKTAPLPATGSELLDSFSVSVAMEYRGHWVKIARSILQLPTTASDSKLELLSGPYPYLPCNSGDIDSGGLYAATTEYHINGQRAFYCDSFRKGPSGPERL
jgi:hypothetical protein